MKCKSTLTGYPIPVSPENVYTSDIRQTEKSIFIYLGIHVYLHMCINKKRGHKFEREQGGIDGRVWGGKGKGK